MPPTRRPSAIRAGTAAATLAVMAALLGGKPEARAAASRPAGSDLDGMVALVTGSTDGLGREVALRLAARGAHVIIHGRNEARGAEVVREIEADTPGSARFYRADFSSVDEVRALATAILRDYDRLDLLVNNAGIWLTQGERQLSADGHELSFAVNYLSGFVLTRSLLPLLAQSAPARVVNVASAAQTPIDFDNPMLERGYSGGRAYGQSKLAQILFTMDLAEELDGSGVRVNALHPATLMETSMVREAGVPARSTIDEGATAVMNLAVGEDVGSGGYYDGLRPVRAHDQAYDRDARQRLRELSVRLTAGTGGG